MTRLNMVAPESTSGKTAELYSILKTKLGKVPNMAKVMANSPSALEAYLSFSGSLSGGLLDPKLKEQIAIRCAEQTGCAYCLSAHTMIGKNSGLSDAEIAESRHGQSATKRTNAALNFVTAAVSSYGGVTDAQLQELRGAGFNDGEISEIVAHVALNLYTNLTNRVAQTDIDFPPVKPSSGKECGCI